jgi:SAM-dependent methyltransferase
MNCGKLLCLGARTGCEVKAAKERGFDAIGIDLYPVGDSGLVIKGDWHSLPFRDVSFDNVYTNSMDHCYDFEKSLMEAKRVLRPEGIYIFETDSQYSGVTESTVSGLNAMWWDSFDDVVRAFEFGGFQFKKQLFFLGKYTALVFRSLG